MKKWIAGIVVVSIILGALYYQPAKAADCHVPTDHATIKLAMADLNCTTIIVAAGTYNMASGESFPISIGRNLTLQGVGAATIDATGSGEDVIDVNAATVNISGFTIKGGVSGLNLYYVDAQSTITNNIISGNSGNGIYNRYASNPTIKNNTITANGLSGIDNDLSSPPITSNDILGNGGYGIYTNHSTSEISYNNITGNSLSGIFNGYSNPPITHNTIAGNGEDGIYNYYNALSFIIIDSNDISGNARYGIANDNSSDTIIRNNAITGSGKSGISNYLSYPDILNNTILGNGEDGIYNDFSAPTITNNIITESHNCGINNDNSSSPSITNNIIKENIVCGIVNRFNANPDILNNTILGNGEDGIYTWLSSNPIIKNNIIIGHSVYGIYNDSSTVYTYNDVWNNPWNYGGSATPGIGSISADPLFISATDDFHLQCSSPAINAGNNGPPTLPATDKDGFPRIRPSGGTVDMGAYEADCVGPITFSVSATPNPTNCSTNVTLTAGVDDTTTGNSNIFVAEYFIDSIGANGTGTIMDPSDGLFNSPLEGVTKSVPVSGLSNGNHTLYVHGYDINGNWGATQSYVLNVVHDCSGPVTSNVSATPNPTNCSTNVTLTAGVDDTTTGNSNIQAAEYFIDSVGANGTGTAMTASDGLFDEVTEGVTATVNISALALGGHTIYVNGQDVFGNWGTYQSITLTVSCGGSKPKPKIPSNHHLAQNNISKGEGLLKQANDLLSQAKAENKDTSSCEKLVTEAEELLAKAKASLTNPIYANNLALQAMEKLKQAIEYLKALIS